jgi:hypothetical protein
VQGVPPRLSGICLFLFAAQCYESDAVGLGIGMATLVYQGYLIVASSERIETTGKWSIWVGVYWSSNGTRQSQVFKSAADTFDTKDEAEKFGLQMGKEWIEKRKDLR